MDESEKVFVYLSEGEDARDARSTIRGFLFQDLIAIEELLKKDTVCVCSEYIEDVFVMSDSEVRFIQAKYYPNSKPTIPQIMRDLYYQFLRFQLYGYKVKPMLCVHTPNKSGKPCIVDLKKYINVDRGEKPPSIENLHQWMEENVYPLSKNDMQNKVFQKFAWNDSMEDFLDNLEIDMEYGDLGTLREKITKQMGELSFVKQVSISNDIKQQVLLGLAVQFIQNAYNDEKKTFEDRICERNNFLQYLENNLCTETEQQIAAYLRGVVIDTWETIERNNRKLTQEQIDVLQCICDNTANWLYSLGVTPDGQLQLLNTVSRNSARDFNDFVEQSLSIRLQFIHEHRDYITVFLRYLWKIMFDLFYGYKDVKNDENRRFLLKPEAYFDKSEKRYLKSIFSEDKVQSSVILSGLNNAYPWESLTNILDRMKRIKPEKWYLKNCLFNNNHTTLHGIYDYDLDVGRLKKEGANSVAMIAGETFRIECMSCIKVDMDDWCSTENCENTIFTNDCVKEEEK